jgi:hypothetical protein
VTRTDPLELDDGLHVPTRRREPACQRETVVDAARVAVAVLELVDGRRRPKPSRELVPVEVADLLHEEVDDVAERHEENDDEPVVGLPLATGVDRHPDLEGQEQDGEHTNHVFGSRGFTCSRSGDMGELTSE